MISLCSKKTAGNTKTVNTADDRFVPAHKKSQKNRNIRIGNLSRSFISLLLICMLVSLSVLVSSGCKDDEADVKPEGQERTDKPVIGLAMDTLVLDRWIRDRDVFVSAANELGAEVIVQNATSDAQEQQNQIRYLINRKVDVLVIISIDADQLVDEVELAHERGISVIAYDRLINNANVDLYVSFDNHEVGRLMASSVLEQIPAGRFALMKGSREDNNVGLVVAGIEQVMAEYPEAQIIAEDYAENWSADDAYAKVRGWLDSGMQPDGIICGNDALAGAALRALAMHKQAGTVLVTGQDADLDACQRIVERSQLMTVYKPIDSLAQIAASAAVSLAAGQAAPANDIINDGSHDVPYYRIMPVTVNAANMNEVIIEAGFHTLKDVYRNIPESERP
ncbi:MAG: substrate-binding domain-containing protein [Eubacteriales bacterium]|nr:substrate-binding domain-containing protein [Eubacteriales bacterium]MDD4682741.1 substrate-binding domain-containing protein [Eubacteriales bacterium]